MVLQVASGDIGQLTYIERPPATVVSSQSILRLCRPPAL